MAKVDKKPKTVMEGDVDAGMIGDAPRVFTYIGHGEDPPRKIHFMGKQEFVRGQLTEVTDPAVLKKLENHKCFVEGEVGQEDLFEQDEAAAKIAEAQRKSDKKVNEAFQKKHKQAPKGEE